ncbi:Protein of unknown function [Pyronema omphalodes CBS 100304]|uniref:Uncharacterized protein n=1 Tax=Pyronema omphalodes (strain CBS 100304) TaxID=1076935 RepID=U4KW02_PYROM|nr:Protein of unknown function [Pyronema omphalodes CBS 100304]
MPMGEWQTIPIPCILFPVETRDAWSKTVLTTAAYADKLDDIFAGYSRGVQLDSDRLPNGQQKQATMQGKAQELPNQELGQAFPEIYNEYYKAFMRIREDLEMLRDSCDTFMKLQHKGNDVTKQMLEDARLDINKTVTTGLNTVLTDVRGVELRPLPKMRMLGREGTFGLKREVPRR